MNTENFIKTMKPAGASKVFAEVYTEDAARQCLPVYKCCHGELHAEKECKSGFLPPILPDLKEVENLFGLMSSRLVDRPMRTFKGVTAEVSRCWKSVTKKG